MTYLFTSESVGQGHPDKVADAISDTVVDYFMEQNSTAVRCACETMVTTNRVIIAGEYKGEFDAVEVERRVRECVRDIGYQQQGFDWATLELTNLMHGQSADIALGTDTFGAGDQGLMFGYACNETPDLMPSAIYYSHEIVRRLEQLRKGGGMAYLGPDAKAQITFEYNDDATPRRITKVVCSTQHREDIAIENLRNTVAHEIRRTLPAKYLDDDTEFLINPTGRFVIGGPDGDCGVTGRKIIVDTYGGYAPHGGGAFSGKDPTKVDRSAAYMMRYIAKNIVASGRADWATCQVSYAIGVKQPTSFYVESNGDSRELTAWVLQNVDLTPQGIINRFNLFRPIYHNTVNYGHFGKPELPWEQIDLFKD